MMNRAYTKRCHKLHLTPIERDRVLIQRSSDGLGGSFLWQRSIALLHLSNLLIVFFNRGWLLCCISLTYWISTFGNTAYLRNAFCFLPSVHCKHYGCDDIFFVYVQAGVQWIHSTFEKTKLVSCILWW